METRGANIMRAPFLGFLDAVGAGQDSHSAFIRPYALTRAPEARELPEHDDLRCH